MQILSRLKREIFTALCVALSVVLPICFHFIPNAGAVICPMHIPVLLCGLICGGFFGGICGICGPLLSSILTGMPPIAILPSMTVELVAYGVLSGLLMKVLRTKNFYVDLYASLTVALVVGKIVAGIVTALFFSPNGYSLALWVTTYLVTALPAIIIQMTLIPLIMFTLSKANVIPKKYKENKSVENEYARTAISKIDL